MSTKQLSVLQDAFKDESPTEHHDLCQEHWIGHRLMLTKNIGHPIGTQKSYRSAPIYNSQ